MSRYPVLTRASALMDDLAPLFSSIERPDCHWISTPNGDHGGEWCARCGSFLVRHLRRRDRKYRQDYILDGGWRTEHDHPVWCRGCGLPLDASLTEYGALSEIEHFDFYGVRPGDAHEALALYEVLNALEYATEGEQVTAAEAACDFAEALLWSAT